MASDELFFGDLDGTCLIVRTDGESMSWMIDDGVRLVIVWPDPKDGSPTSSAWMHLTPDQAVELAEAIIGRWGD